MILYKNPSVTEMFDDEEEEYVLYDSSASKVKMLNITGAYIWTQLSDDPFERDVSIATLINKFREINGNTTEVAADIKYFIDAMIEEGVLIVQPDKE